MEPTCKGDFLNVRKEKDRTGFLAVVRAWPWSPVPGAVDALRDDVRV